MADITVACVLRSAPHYGPIWVQRLQGMVRRHLDRPHRFVCLSDIEIEGVEVIPLQNKWPKWWPKQELYSGALGNGLVIYFDLDTVVRGDLTPFTEYQGLRAVLRDFFTPSMIGTGMVVWRDNAMLPVWQAFVKDPAANMAAHPIRSDYFTKKHIGPADRIQDVWPGLVTNYKSHTNWPTAWLTERQPDARVVCFHGAPKAHQLPRGHELRTEWETAA